MRAGIGIAPNRPVMLLDQPGMGRQRRANPVGHLQHAGRFGFEGNGGFQHVRRVDRPDRGGIFGAGEADHGGFPGRQAGRLRVARHDRQNCGDIEGRSLRMESHRAAQLRVDFHPPPR